MRNINASDINSYLFCARSWLYKRNGIKSDNDQKLLKGRDTHQKHYHTIKVNKNLRRISLLIIFIAIALIIIQISSI